MGGSMFSSAPFAEPPCREQGCWCSQHMMYGASVRFGVALQGAGTCVVKGLACRVAFWIQDKNPLPAPSQVPVRAGVLVPPV